MLDANGGRDKAMKDKLHKKIATMTNEKAKDIKFEKTPEGKIKFGEFIKKLDFGFKE